MKKWKVIVPIVVVVGGLAAASPALYGLLKEYKAEKAISAEYDAFMASNQAFYDNSFFNGVDISGLTKDEALEAVTENFEGNTITINSEDGSETDTFKYSKLSADYDNLTSEIENAYNTQTFTKAEYVNGAELKEYSYDILQDVDFENIDLSGLKCTDLETRTASEDAYISVDKKTGDLEIVDEVYGNVLKDGALESKIEGAVRAGEDSITLLPADYVLPEVLSDDATLLDTEKYYKTLLSKTLTLDVCGLTLNLDTDTVKTLYDFEPGNEVDEDALLEYVITLKKNYDTYGTARQFATSTGEIVAVLAGDYGWLIDAEGTEEAIETALLSDKAAETASATYKVTGQRPANDEIQNTYVEINIRDQKIYMYVNGVQIVNDDVTTGMVGDPACITATGTYSLAYKQTNVVLKGPTWNDFVYYWMPYDLTNAVGMHDATWRTDEEFGGTNRYGNGSHGCVNCRLNTVATIYENIQMDTPIIVWE